MVVSRMGEVGHSLLQIIPRIPFNTFGARLSLFISFTNSVIQITSEMSLTNFLNWSRRLLVFS